MIFSLTLLSLLAAATVNSAAVSSTPIVDLGYSIYQGVYNASTQQNLFKGIRYATPSVGKMRWQPPQAPRINRSSIIDASQYGSRCPQGAVSPEQNLFLANYTSLVEGSEDCLFLNVFSPAGAKNLPVFVYIHGGGYAQGDGSYNAAPFMLTNNNKFVTVLIQYRLGAFGFLAGDEIVKHGTSNAGLLDQYLALEWVQKYISRFGGDPSSVTIGGESAGGGAVLQMAVAHGGNDGTRLFKNIFAASPYLPPQHGSTDSVPNQLYAKFADQAGCTTPEQLKGCSIFDCLLNKDSKTLQTASYVISGSGVYGTYAFVPVVDGSFILERPTLTLSSGKKNGINLMVGNNANEGVLFAPKNISSDEALQDFLHAYLPTFDDAAVQKIEAANTIDDSPPDLLGLFQPALYSTDGINAPTALNQSQFATGQQQRLDNLLAEAILICSTYYLSKAFEGHAWKYQYSHLPAIHGEDVLVMFPDLATALVGEGNALTPEFIKAVHSAWGNFIINSDPTPTSTSQFEIMQNNQTTVWPAYTLARPNQVDFNITGGKVSRFMFTEGTVVLDLPIVTGPDVVNAFTLNDGNAWEGGRYDRCRVWESLSHMIPY